MEQPQSCVRISHPCLVALRRPQIAATVSASVPQVEAFAPDVFVAIGGGGFIPARMLRTEVKKPILAARQTASRTQRLSTFVMRPASVHGQVSLELYDDATKTANATVLRKQWFDETPGTFGALVRGRRVLIVDEVRCVRASTTGENKRSCAKEGRGPRIDPPDQLH